MTPERARAVAMYAATRLTPCRAVVRCGDLACVEEVVRVASGRTLGDHFAIDDATWAGVIAGFCGRALRTLGKRAHSIPYQHGHHIDEDPDTLDANKDGE